MLGQTLGHYRIDARLGEGGMGVVYRATDTRLGRTVAIKVLHADRTADPERRRRFIHEARSASALNHPNIITIHEIDTQEGVDFIVMEYVEGQTLDALIGRKGLRLGEALKYAVQIADALAKAHAAGIVHRDLKPANVMVTADGLVKVLDFGLAKLTEPAGADPSSATETLLSPEAPNTQEGSIVGTVAYMSPEQAEGRRVDARSDIFSFGSVLYEMVTGRPAFHGRSKISTLSAILHQEPKALGEVVEPAPNELERTIARCLRKDPERRFQHMADVRIALLDLKEESESGRLARPAEGVGRRRPRWPAVSAVAAALLAGAVLGRWLTRPSPAAGLRLTQLTYDSGLTTEPALSPDGKLVAYASDRAGDGGLDIWVQQIATGQAIRLTRHPSDDHEPSFSPDGSRIAFRSEREGGGVYVVSALGGEEKLIAAEGRNPRFSPDGTRIAYWVGNIGGDPSVAGTSKIYVAPAGGGNPVQVQPGLPTAQYPVWSPDGARLLFWSSGEAREGEDWWTAPAGAGRAAATGAMAAFRARGLAAPPAAYMIAPAEWSAPGDRVLFSAAYGDSVSLWTLPVDRATGRAAGVPERLTAGSGVEARAAGAAGGLYAFAAISDNIDIWKLAVDHGNARAKGGPQRLTTSAGPDVLPAVTADGSRVVFTSRRSGNPEVWIKDLASGQERALRPSGSLEAWGTISWDGSKVAYRAQEGKQSVLYVAPASGGVPEKVCDGCVAVWSFTPDLRSALVWPGDRTVALFDLATKRRATILNRPGYAPFRTHFSPDGRWLAFHARNLPGRSAIYVAPFRGANLIPESEWIAVTENDAYDVAPVWSPDGAVLYFISERDGFRCLWSRRLDAAKRPAGPAAPVQHFHEATLSMIPMTTNRTGLSAARDFLVFSLVEVRGNIWLARREGSNAGQVGE